MIRRLGRKSTPGCTVHTDHHVLTAIGDEVSITHGAVVHGVTIEDHVLVAMDAVVLPDSSLNPR